jgi:hypothetical protein
MKIELLNIREHVSHKYTPRTYYNAKSADLTLALAVDLNTAGELCTHKAAGDKYIGFKLDDSIDDLTISKELYKVMKANNVKKLNIAGNGIYTLAKYDCNQEFINLFTYNVISRIHQHLKIEKIFTGGQTGVDLAGAVTGYLLEIPTEVTLPNGYLQRFEDKIDVNGSYEKVFEQIHNGAINILNKIKQSRPKI